MKSNSSKSRIKAKLPFDTQVKLAQLSSAIGESQEFLAIFFIERFNKLNKFNKPIQVNVE